MTRDSPRILSKTAMTNFLSSFMSSPSVSKTVSVVSTKTSRLAETSTATGTVTFVDGEETKKDEIYKEEAELKLGDLSISWWTFVLSVVGLIFLLNTCISVCLFRKVKNLMEKKHPKQAVHPTPFL
ncbi:uncharacterized protein LOC123545739 [Mercenaria mercenaria]|uniref:uncharacterized protein LOC123545739 n=1 Tax=Mercenaria mercenaria TaxID=6596 RepID=UPI00234EDA6E|nr:uncharacterized protein LOC123545739 [Mercenaria mercenaria]